MLFIKRGRFSQINPAVERVLRSAFPGWPLAVFDLFADFCPRHRRALAGCVMAALRRYGGALAGGRRDLLDCVERTPEFVRTTRRIIRSELAAWRGRAVFSLQTQALFDGSQPGVPHFVYTDHSHLANLSYPTFDARELFPAAWVDAEREIYLAARKVFVMSRHVRESLVDRYALDPARAVWVGAGSNAPMPATVRLDRGRYAVPRIVFVGIDWERKGGPELLAAFAVLRRRRPAATLAVIGCTPAVSGPGVEVRGRLGLAEVRAELEKASIFCLPSRIEPFGIAVVEAFACGLPVVATRIGALADLVIDGETGLLVPPLAPAELAAALAALADAPDRCARMAAAGRAMVLGRYTWEAVAGRFRDEIRPCLAARAGAVGAAAGGQPL